MTQKGDLRHRWLRGMIKIQAAMDKKGYDKNTPVTMSKGKGVMLSRPSMCIRDATPPTTVGSLDVFLGKERQKKETKNARENTSIIQPPCTDQIGRLVPRNADDKQPKNTPLITAVIKLPPYAFLPLPQP